MNLRLASLDVLKQPNQAGTWTLYFDGGCKPNPGFGYGSWELVEGDGNVYSCRCRIEFGAGKTNNQAEWLALLDGLVTMASDDLRPERLRIMSDAVLVVNQLSGRWKCKSPVMRELRDMCIDVLVTDMPGMPWTIHWHSRVHNVARFGH